MSVFANNKITAAGRLLLGEVLAGGVFTPTRLVMGAGYLPTGQSVEGVTAIIAPVKDLEITTKETVSYTHLTLPTILLV